jgi:signal peptidase II
MSGSVKTPSALSRIVPMLSLVGGAVGIDQLVKWLVETRLPFHELVPVIPMFALYRTWNEGIAFSLLKGLPDSGLLALTAVVIVFVLYLWWRTPGERGIAHLGFALIIGGAAGQPDRPGRLWSCGRLHPVSHRDLVVCGLQPGRQLHQHRCGADRAR